MWYDYDPVWALDVLAVCFHSAPYAKWKSQSIGLMLEAEGGLAQVLDIAAKYTSPADDAALAGVLRAMMLNRSEGSRKAALALLADYQFLTSTDIRIQDALCFVVAHHEAESIASLLNLLTWKRRGAFRAVWQLFNNCRGYDVRDSVIGEVKNMCLSVQSSGVVRQFLIGCLAMVQESELAAAALYDIGISHPEVRMQCVMALSAMRTKNALGLEKSWHGIMDWSGNIDATPALGLLEADTNQWWALYH